MVTREREDNIYYARLAEQGERYEDMIRYMKEVAAVSTPCQATTHWSKGHISLSTRTESVSGIIRHLLSLRLKAKLEDLLLLLPARRKT